MAELTSGIILLLCIIGTYPTVRARIILTETPSSSTVRRTTVDLPTTTTTDKVDHSGSFFDLDDSDDMDTDFSITNGTDYEEHQVDDTLNEVPIRSLNGSSSTNDTLSPEGRSAFDDFVNIPISPLGGYKSYEKSFVYSPFYSQGKEKVYGGGLTPVGPVPLGFGPGIGYPVAGPHPLPPGPLYGHGGPVGYPVGPVNLPPPPYPAHVAIPYNHPNVPIIAGPIGHPPVNRPPSKHCVANFSNMQQYTKHRIMAISNEASRVLLTAELSLLHTLNLSDDCDTNEKLFLLFIKNNPTRLYGRNSSRAQHLLSYFNMILHKLYSWPANSKQQKLITFSDRSVSLQLLWILH